MSNRYPNSSFRTFLMKIHDNLHTSLAQEPRRPGYDSTLELISISGEDYFPAKADLLALDDKAITFFNSAAAYVPDLVTQAFPDIPLSAPLEKRLVASGLLGLALLPKRIA